MFYVDIIPQMWYNIIIKIKRGMYMNYIKVSQAAENGDYLPDVYVFCVQKTE